MPNAVNILDLFSGAGGFSWGAQMAGIEANHYFSEIDKHAIAVYQHNFPNAKYVGSVTDVRGADLPRINLITFGSPCQDFSVAGRRSGMEGQRSSLISEAIRLIHECRPDFFIWENVKGVYSSNSGRDFQAILREFANIGGYRLEWQLLNTKWFLPQNRERIYLVGHLATAERSFRQVFPIQTKTNWTNKRAAEAAVIATLQAPGNSGGHHSGMTIIVEDYPEAVKKTLANICFTYGDALSFDFYNKVAHATHTPTLTEPQHNSIGIFDGYRIRRLTPIECERLQGFPDGWTEYGNYGGEVKKVSDTQRYKMMGNAATAVVVKAIMERINA